MFWWPPRSHRQRLTYVAFRVNDVSVFLRSDEEITKMTTVVNIGHTISMAIAFLDQNGNPMLTTPTPDSPPTWTNTTPATETLAVATSGLTAVATPVAPGTDTVNLSVTVASQSFAASLAVEVDAAPQVLTAVAITPTVN
jgi:hypothetical protein